MPRFRFYKRRLMICGVVINIILIVLFNIFYPDKTELLPDFSVNASKHFIQKFVQLKPKRVLSFEIGRPKPKETPSSCRFTQSEGLQAVAENYLYPSDEIEKCEQSHQSICSISGGIYSDGSMVVNCEQNPCKETVKFGSLNKETGDMQWEDVRSSKLEEFIKSVGLNSLSLMHPFFFLKCGEYNSSRGIHDYTQVVSIPILETINQSTTESSTKENINVNILFLNSISRRHFYRSLPKTIEAFRMINLNPKSTSNVLDFELYQALSADPREGLLEFITGKKMKPGDSFTKSLLSYFKRAGFQTLWQDDRCWKFTDSFLKYFGINERTLKDKWQKMDEIMKSYDIGTTGMTHSNCFAFQENRIKSMEDYAQKSICINGKFHHEHFLEFVGKYLNQVDSAKYIKPLFSLTSLNLGCEESGKHIQILDKALAGFVKKMAADMNTITFLLSDHGNTFDNFPIQTNEGQYEQYNPFMFVILPKFVERRLTESMKSNLLNNQVSLICINDIYNTIKSLVEYKENTNTTQNLGIFKEFESGRNCKKLGISSSSLCICDGWNSVQSPTFFHYIIAEFALGQLNNMIADQYLNHWSKNRETPFVTCEHLLGLKISNITQKRIENGYIETQMNIHVQRKQILTVKVKWHGDNNPAMEMTLVNYHRKTMNSKVSCSAYIDKELCICHEGHFDYKNTPNWKQQGSVFDRRSKSDNRHNHCLYILTRDYQESTVFEATNMCGNVEYNVRLNFELDNMRTPDIVPMNVTITPESIRFLTFVTPMHLKNPGTWEYEIAVTVKKLK